MSNGTITSIVQTMGGIEEQIATQLIMGYLDVQVPFFALPVVNQITAFIIGKFIDLVQNKLTIMEINLVNIVATANQESDFIKAALANADAQISGDQNAISTAQAALISAARSYFKFIPA